MQGLVLALSRVGVCIRLSNTAPKLQSCMATLQPPMQASSSKHALMNSTQLATTQQQRQFLKQSVRAGLYCFRCNASAPHSFCEAQNVVVHRAASLTWQFPLSAGFSTAAAAATPGAAYDKRPHSRSSSVAAAARHIVAAADVFHFNEDWVNRVGLTGVVVQGPKLMVYENSKKASMVLALYNRKTGDFKADRSWPILVEAWGQRAEALHREVKAGTAVYVHGHLALDTRPGQSTKGHGPALIVLVDGWNAVSPDTLPADRKVYEYKGEFEAVFRAYGFKPSATAAAPTTAGAAAETAGVSDAAAAAAAAGVAAPPNSRRRPLHLRGLEDKAPATAPRKPRTAMPGWRQTAFQQLLEGRSLPDIAAAAQVQVTTAFQNLIEAAEAQGPNSSAWPPLLQAAHLTPQQQPSTTALCNALAVAVRMGVGQESGQQKLKPLREYLLSESSGVAGVVQQQETAHGGPSITYEQLKLLLAIHRVGGSLEQHL